MCLNALTEDFTTFDILGSACSDVVGILISCSVYGRMYGSPRGPESFQKLHAQVVDFIPNIYSDILDFNFSVKRYMSHRQFGDFSTLLLFFRSKADYV